MFLELSPIFLTLSHKLESQRHTLQATLSIPLSGDLLCVTSVATCSLGTDPDPDELGAWISLPDRAKIYLNLKYSDLLWFPDYRK